MPSVRPRTGLERYSTGLGSSGLCGPGPGRADAVVATERGLSVHWRGLAQIPHALAYGIAVFPQGRELMPVSQLRDLARMRARVVFPTPRVPENK